MLKKELNGNIQILDFVENWEESIRIAGKPLLEKGVIEERYIHAMIKSINELGFYVVLRENLAMPHARPEDGVINTGISFLKLNNPVNYGEQKIYLIFILASKDADSHMEILMKLMELFQNDKCIDKLINANNIQEIEEIIKEY
ncbi:PTS sugar transporter subunit IIA [Leptotrichia sp. OH3620_COT-345]|uniref:PTS sugar transporter subunit IIA n=1 Tax=Leptotrichia sp. OH3620_COT-345 TaxID=2491048 RepID=UPI000F64DAD2|nr:PTS sugar transporter subunit IIA [Leptotrichia sp. OH3620_COT-345]RRD40505.1 PTS sugar transporter subunit IIA [Leptotrichia sp. OH3620_COT-345]